jgi:hypothetical protein
VWTHLFTVPRDGHLRSWAHALRPASRVCSPPPPRPPASPCTVNPWPLSASPLCSRCDYGLALLRLLAGRRRSGRHLALRPCAAALGLGLAPRLRLRARLGLRLALAKQYRRVASEAGASDRGPNAAGRGLGAGVSQVGPLLAGCNQGDTGRSGARVYARPAPGAPP